MLLASYVCCKHSYSSVFISFHQLAILPSVHWPRHALSELFMNCACVGALCEQLSPVVDVILCIYLYIK